MCMDFQVMCMTLRDESTGRTEQSMQLAGQRERATVLLRPDAGKHVSELNHKRSRDDSLYKELHGDDRPRGSCRGDAAVRPGGKARCARTRRAITCSAVARTGGRSRPTTALEPMSSKRGRGCTQTRSRAASLDAIIPCCAL